MKFKIIIGYLFLFNIYLKFFYKFKLWQIGYYCFEKKKEKRGNIKDYFLFIDAICTHTETQNEPKSFFF